MSSNGLDASTRIVVAAFWFVVLLGVPFWWKTTEVYRASLPLAEIDTWQTWQASNKKLNKLVENSSNFICISAEICKLSLPTTFTIHLPSPWSYSPSELENQLHVIQRDLSTVEDESSCVNFPLILNGVPWEMPTSWRDNLEAIFSENKDAPTGTYHIYIGPSQLETPYEYSIIIGVHRSHILQMNDITPETIDGALRTLLPLIFLKDQDSLSQMACKGAESDKYDMNSIRTLKYSPRYQVTFSLMNNDPRGISVDWNIRDSMKSKLMQHYASLSMKPQFKNRADKPSYYYFNPEHLPHFVNSAEWNLASTISSYPTINLILYVPSPEETPLRIHDSKEQPLLTNAFLIPRWGGVVIKNPSKKALAEKQLNFTKKDLQPIMKIFVAQLRSLMGIPNINSMADKMPSTVNATFMSSPITGITTLEKDQLIRHRTVENMVNAIATLHSLQQLVTEIPKMVVLDHIALQVQQSLNALQLACDVLSQGKYTPALQYSIEAIELSEKAFFDPTMVSMLYFPDEHKYAIYMPLFVPISVPLVMALLKEVKNISKQRKEKRNLKVE
ncbi:GPI transamidase GPI17 [Phycomyces blakesleeanus NRRL 1555(-)]|uniref:GPI transamidase GPI17 n=1 Tax=Phycomyces blakesleeanus (strain ATCC 8743b / DSM 1359 / FGSC 10004 / NBRC 33097 / NRRL 1555) TaxID=763407 RepID=A0A162TFY1_PHYB8|nr:GPI transamidase GPI17 [Phycomyces blakesleeanus NRRL 1555(-)]OAD68272.1 GPI transamidase GPI17 [Phycomyces blakesleeanus NRRL 1555(-)]|eukprot:XP_018286312.1 GPI transamidase GPI17 [Phycomyces blakesleeanus NRRL 1555(-)]